MRIDVHAHYYPERYTDRLVDLGLNQARGAGQSPDLSSRLKAMDDTCTEVQILSSAALDTQVRNVEGAVEAARLVNDLYAETSQQHGGRFRAFGWVPLPYVDEAISEMQRCLDQLGFAGICFPTLFHERPLDDKAFDPFWGEMNRRKAKAYVHPVGSHSMCHHGMGDFGLHTAIGSMAQVQMAAQRIVYSGLSARYPDIEFIFAVCGGYLPYTWERIRRNLDRALTLSAKDAVGGGFFSWIKDTPITIDDPMKPFRRFWYDTSVQDIPEAMKCVKSSYGVDRLLLGSDEIFASLVEVVSYIETNPYLTAEEKRMILDENAQKLFRF
ncbi:amidohydrolase family protein [Sphingobium sp. V4]|uniref:amidohydrolase family protein n=1 Tax=Sphingobium sp. V4 TaxID=3038927 RepID=UPI002558240F|nr:amidohydrolase family protein [Sphingobium sp. V4]WIW88042.1 amidohydrolase family protein [Sphingobium sp. V4]